MAKRYSHSPINELEDSFRMIEMDKSKSPFPIIGLESSRSTKIVKRNIEQITIGIDIELDIVASRITREKKIIKSIKYIDFFRTSLAAIFNKIRSCKQLITSENTWH